MRNQENGDTLGDYHNICTVSLLLYIEMQGNFRPALLKRVCGRIDGDTT
jgi:hypothetical protein